MSSEFQRDPLSIRSPSGPGQQRRADESREGREARQGMGAFVVAGVVLPRSRPDRAAAVQIGRSGRWVLPRQRGRRPVTRRSTR